MDSVGNDLESDDFQRLNDLTLQSPNVLQPLNDSNKERALELTADSAVSDCNESKWFFWNFVVAGLKLTIV